MSTITISDRASWLAYRADWRLRYAKASESVRKTKRTMRDAVARRRGGASQAEINEIDHSIMPRCQANREMKRASARRLMLELDAAKEQRDELLKVAKKTAIAA